MSSSAHDHSVDNSLAGKILHHTEVPVQKCYQCGKCSAGCPLADEMDFPPSLFLRMLQTRDPKLEEQVISSYAIWICLSCEMCISRCPMEIDIPVMVDYLRQESIRQNKVHPKAKDIVSFHKAFLDSVRNTGRLYEMGLIVDYKMRSFNLMQDVSVAPKMFAKGKLHILPELIKGLKEMSRIFKNTKKENH